MGMYTSLRADLTLKPQFVAVIQTLLDHYTQPETSESWAHVVGVFPEHGFLKAWAAEYRADFIPFGACCWRADAAYPRRPSLEGSRWRFQCNLKNYNDEIAKFLKMIAPMVQSVNALYRQYEENAEPTPELLELTADPEAAP